MAYGEELKITPFGEGEAQGGWVYDGGNVETKTGAFWFGLMRFCGCGRPEDAVSLIREALDGPSRDYKPETPPLRHDELSALIAKDPDRAAWLVMYALDAWQLTEHGGSINASWLTARGRQAIATFAEDKNATDGNT